MSPHLPEITVLDDGPLNVEGIDALQYTDGETVPVQGPVALCRCGHSGRKPFCDGSHTAPENRPPKRHAPLRYRVRNYRGTGITIHFSLQACAHAGVCLKMQPSVFDRSRSPWIDAHGASAEAIIAAIRRCPTGALSYTADQDLPPEPPAPPRITIVRKGPYSIHGRIHLNVPSGAQPYNPERYCLCRCGKTAAAPFCDGSHLPEPERRNIPQE